MRFNVKDVTAAALITAIAIVAAAAFPRLFTLPDERSYYYGSLLWADGRWEAPLSDLVAWGRDAGEPPYSPARAGPPAQFVPTISGMGASEKAPGYILWLTLLRWLGWPAGANVILMVLIIPASYFLLKRPLGGGAWPAVALFATSPFVFLFAYQPFMPTFFDAALFWMALALIANVGTGGRAPAAKAALTGLTAAWLGLSRVIYWPAALLFGFALVACGGPPKRRAAALAAFAIPAAAAAAFNLYYNATLWGSPFKTGYYENFTVNNPNAVSSLWEPSWRQVPPEPPSGATLPRPRVASVGCDARWVWVLTEDTALTFPPAWRGEGRASVAWAVTAPPGEEVVVPVAKLALFAGDECLYDYAAGRTDKWNLFAFEVPANNNLRVNLDVAEGSRAVVYLTPPEVVTAGGHYRLTNWLRPTTSLGEACARNVLAIYPYLLICIPALLLIPFGVGPARKVLPAGVHITIALLFLGTVLVYLQSRIYVPGNVVSVTRFYAPAVGPAAIWGGTALASARRATRWLTVILLSVFAAATFAFYLAGVGAVDWPALISAGSGGFFR